MHNTAKESNIILNRNIFRCRSIKCFNNLKGKIFTRLAIVTSNNNKILKFCVQLRKELSHAGVKSTKFIHEKLNST
ncbi:hypothetical protein HZS_4511 [Henneguya salminicola]|nr:hypothetical protein HZS_4511 [Henneguya salminicola]